MIHPNRPSFPLTTVLIEPHFFHSSLVTIHPPFTHLFVTQSFHFSSMPFLSHAIFLTRGIYRYTTLNFLSHHPFLNCLFASLHLSFILHFSPYTQTIIFPLILILILTIPGSCCVSFRTLTPNGQAVFTTPLGNSLRHIWNLTLSSSSASNDPRKVF